MKIRDLEFFNGGDPAMPRARAPKEFALLGDFLESELQGDRAVCKQLIDKISRGGNFEITGNMSHLQISGEQVRLEALFDDRMPVLILDKTDFLQTVQKWKAFLEHQ